LGDLYLWHGDYENAAIVYHDLIYQNNLIVYAYRSTWTVTNGVFVSRESKYTLWPGMVFNMNNYNEQITMLASSTENGRGAELDSLSWYKNELIPSAIAINNWNSQFYFYNKDSYRKGDLRGDMGSYISPANGSFFDDKNMKVSSSENVITKFHLMTKETVKAVSINRVALLYLHYAEALNRIKKPNMAFAILKDGLGPYTMSIDTITPPNEKYSNITNQTIYSYLNFDNAEFDNSIAIHGRGCGNIWYATDKYNIPTLSNINDSMDWVEDKIIEECALETAFEGNRFHDLMRIAFRRTDPSYLANKVAEKYGSDKEAIRTKLLDVNNWYIH
jgi:starch-binding outer membrane protein, SusD/RagB family